MYCTTVFTFCQVVSLAVVKKLKDFMNLDYFCPELTPTARSAVTNKHLCLKVDTFCDDFANRCKFKGFASFPQSNYHGRCNNAYRFWWANPDDLLHFACRIDVVAMLYPIA